MLRNYLKIALRTLQRNAGYTAINLVGITAGLMACLLIGLYVRHELSYDDFHEKGDRIYRPVIKQESFSGGASWQGWTAGTLAPQARSQMAGVADAVRLKEDGPTSVRYEDEVVEGLQSHFAESALFSIFSFPLLHGNPETVLSRPNTVVLTASLARRLFGTTDVVGKTLRVQFRRSRTLEVTGVSADVPPNSHLSYDILMSFETLLNTRLSISSEQFLTYVLLDEQHPPLDTLSQRVLAHHEKSQPPVTDARLQPLDNIYFGDIPAPKQGRREHILLFSAVAVLILLLTCANYANLAIARSTQRIREIGVRKTIGASRPQLVAQFLGEATVLSVAALPLAAGGAYILLPVFNRLAGTQISSLGQLPLSGWLVVGGAALATGILAGSYPALFLSRFEPVQILRERLSIGGTALRKGLIVFQFALSAALIFGTGILYQQLAYVQEKQLGFDREQVVTIPLKRPSVAKQAGALKQEVARLAGVRSVSMSLGAPFVGGFGKVGMVLDTETGTVDLHRAQVDETFLETLDISVVAGRPLTAEDVTENAPVCLLNQTATEALGWDAPRAAIGAEVGFSGRECRVVGVVADFHFRPLYRPIEPLRLEPVQQPRTLTVRLTPEDVPGTIDRLRRTWNDVAAPLPFSVDFLDQRVAESYRQEQRTATLLGSFAGLAILLACLGLLGLSAYVAARRTKEIGVRKVLGATTLNIVTLLSKKFLMLVGVACLIAAPVAYVGAQRWLQNFAYRIEISPLLFLGVSAGAVLLALATIGYQALRAARLDPTTTLRKE